MLGYSYEVACVIFFVAPVVDKSYFFQFQVLI